jgi:cytochrome c553
MQAERFAKPRNQRRAELGSMLAGVDVEERRPPSAQGSDVACDRSPSPHTLGYKAWVGFAAVAMLAAASAAAGEVSGELRREVNEVLRLTPDLLQGAKIFSYCAGCHMTPSNGLPEGWVPNISGQHPRYLAKQLIDYRHSVRWDARMEPVAKGHGLRGSQDIADVVAFLAAQPAEWNIPDERPAVATEDSKFYRTHCSSCHGLTGEGNNFRYVPRIAGQDFAYLLRQMHDVVDGRRPNMRREHLGALEDLDVLQLVSLSCYVSHLGGPDGEFSTPELTSWNVRWSSLLNRERPALRMP